MKSKIIIAACMLAILAILTITYVSPAYSSGNDPKCAECTKTTSCDESCSKVCTDNDRKNCTVNMESSLNNTSPSGSSSSSTSASEVKTEIKAKDNSCNNCTKTSCGYMNSRTEKSNK